MALVRVTVAGTVGKAIRINSDATAGAQIGSNILLPDGSTPSLAALANALYVASPPGDFISDTDSSSGSAGFVFESDIIDGTLLARVADDELITGAYTFKNAAGIVIQDAGGTDSVAISHDGTDANYVYVNTGTVSSTGAAFYKFDNNVTLQSASAIPVISIIGGINNHSIAIRPTGMVFNHDVSSQTFTISGDISDIAAGTVDVDFDAITATSYGGILEANLLDKTAAETVSGAYTFSDSAKFTKNGGTNSLSDSAIQLSSAFPRIFWVQAGATADEGIWAIYAGSDQLKFALNNDAEDQEDFWLRVSRSGITPTTIEFTGEVRIVDVGDTDYVAFSQDGADFNIVGVNTANINLTGVTAILAGTVDADFDAITATSYGGILEANLLDKTAVETVSAQWTHSGRLITDDSTTVRAGFNIPTGVAPTAPVQGDVWVEAAAAFIRLNGVNESLIDSVKVYRIGHTYGIVGRIKVPSGQKNFIAPFFVSFASGQTAKLVKARYIINTGTSVTCKLQKNGSDITGFTGISVTTTVDETDPADVVLANNDKLALVVTAISGNPQNMSFTLFLEYTQ